MRRVTWTWMQKWRSFCTELIRKMAWIAGIQTATQVARRRIVWKGRVKRGMFEKAATGTSQVAALLD